MSNPLSAIQRLTHQQLARFTVAFIFIYHGLVPKIIAVDAYEVYMSQQLSLFIRPVVYIAQRDITLFAGICELMLGLLILLLPKRKLPLWLAFIGLVSLLIVVVFLTPELLTGAFNPVTTNIAAMVLVWIALHPDMAKSSI